MIRTYHHLFGPVPSRRLGWSLGIDVVPMKTCSMSCIYCECGATTFLTVQRQDFYSAEVIIAEIQHFLSTQAPPDFLTFSGCGEPLLYRRIGSVLDFIKSHHAEIPVALLTNGVLLADRQVRGEIFAADVILPSLDAATNEIFKKINRPHSSINVETHIQGLISLRQEFRKAIWLEVFIVPGLNDSVAELDALKSAIVLIHPDRIQLNTLDRPGAVATLNAASKSKLQEISEYWNLPRVEIVSHAARNPLDENREHDVVVTILQMISRRPCTFADLALLTRVHPNELNKIITLLEKQGKIFRRRGERGAFYMIS